MLSTAPTHQAMSKFAYLNECASYFYKYAGHFWNYHANIGKFIAVANSENRARERAQGLEEKPDIVHCRTDEDLHQILSKKANNGPEHTIAVFRVRGNHNQAVSILKMPEPDAGISCVVIDSCEFSPPDSGETWHWFDKAVLENACNKWAKVLQNYPKSQVIVLALGTQGDASSCGEYAVSGAKKLQDFRSDMQAVHLAHYQGRLDAPRYLWGTNKVHLTEDAGFLAKQNKRLLAKLFVHESSRERLQKLSNRYGLEGIDLREGGKADPSQPYDLLGRFDEQKGVSIYRKRDKWLSEIHGHNTAPEDSPPK